MEGLSSSCEIQTNTQGMSDDWSLESIIPHHLRTPQIGSQGLVNNWIQYSIQDDVFSVPTYVPATSSAVSSVLEAALDERHIEESLNRAKMVAYQLQLQRYAMNEKEENKRGQNVPTQHGRSRRMVSKTTGWKSSVYRGVTKCNEERFEAFVWDNTISEEKGRTVYIGGYSTEIEAAKAHDLVSIKIYGVSTLTNFPVRCYWKEILEMQKMSKREFIIAMRRKGKGFSGSDSPYRGVLRIMEGRRWQAWLGQDNGLPRIFLGTYYSAEDAARAYDIALIKFKGMDAITNFDLSSYEVKGIMESARRPTVKAISTMGEALLQRGSNEASSSSSLHQHNHQQLLSQQLNNSLFSFQGYQNPNLIQSTLYSLEGLTGTGSGVGINGNSIVNNGAMFPNQGANTVEQSLLMGTGQDFQTPQAQHNQVNVNINNEFLQNLLNNQSQHQKPSLPLAHGYQNLGLQSDLSSPHLPSGFGSQLSGGNMEALSNALNVESPMSHMVNESPGEANGASSLGLHSVKPFNQEFEAAQLQLPVMDQSSEPHEYHPNNLDHNPNQNLNSCFSNSSQNLYCSETKTSSLSQMIESVDDLDISEYLNSCYDSFQNYCSETNTGSQSQLTESQDDLDIIIQYLMNSSDDSFQNPCSETNTGSQSQLAESQDDLDISQYLMNSSDDSFQNPCSETNTGSQSQLTESQDDLDISQYLMNSSDDSFQNPCSETNTGSQSQLTESQDGLDISQYLNSSYIMEETDWFGDCDEFWAAMEVDKGL